MRPLSIKTLALLKNNNKNKIKKKTSKKKKTAMPKCFVVVVFLFTIKLSHVVAFSSSSMLCLGRMFLIPFEAHLLALLPLKQCAAGNKWSCLVDKSLISPLSKQSITGNKCFSLADNMLASSPPIVWWFRQWGVALSRLLCAMTPWNGCKKLSKA